MTPPKRLRLVRPDEHPLIVKPEPEGSVITVSVDVQDDRDRLEHEREKRQQAAWDVGYYLCEIDVPTLAIGKLVE